MKLHAALLTTLALSSAFACAEETGDWLIARDAGQWTLVAKGPMGSIEKTAPNQEVLRMGENGRVLVMTLPAGDGDGRVMCSERERSDFRQACSSAFLDCKPDGGHLGLVLWGALSGGREGARDQRNRLSCRIDENAILQAARTVGMISRILPKSPSPAPQSLAQPSTQTPE